MEQERCYWDELVLSGSEAAVFFEWYANKKERLRGVGTDLQPTRFLGSVRADFWK